MQEFCLKMSTRSEEMKAKLRLVGPILVSGEEESIRPKKQHDSASIVTHDLKSESS